MTDRRRPESLDVDTLLRVDVQNELQRVAEAQLEGSWQIPAELVRRAIAAEATQVDVDIRSGARRAAVSVRDDGQPISSTELERLVMLLDRGREEKARHHALTELEEHGGAAWIALAGLHPRRLQIISRDLELVYERHDARDEIALRRVSPQEGTRVILEAPLDVPQASQWLLSACRFAPVPVSLRGHRIPRGFSNTLIARKLGKNLRGAVALLRDGDIATIWLLHHGIVLGHLTLPECMPFEAGIEVPVETLSAADAREAAQPLLESVRAAAAQLARLAGKEASDWPPQAVARLRQLVLEGLVREPTREELHRVRAFPVLVERGQQRQLHSIAELRVHSTLVALFPKQSPTRFSLPDEPVVILDPQERGPFTEITGLALVPPPSRIAARTLFANLRLGLRRLVDRISRLRSQLPGAPRPIDIASLNDQEARFIQQLRTALEPDELEPVLCAGAGTIRQREGRLLLPRRNVVVQRAMERIDQSERWLYPATVALLDGRSLPSTTLRKAWLHALGLR